MKHSILQQVMAYSLPTEEELAEIRVYDEKMDVCVKQAQLSGTTPLTPPSKPKALEEFEAFLKALVDWLRSNVLTEKAGADDVMPIAIQSLQGEQREDCISLQAKLDAMSKHAFFLNRPDEGEYALVTLRIAVKSRIILEEVVQCKQASADYLDFLVDKIRSEGKLNADQNVGSFIENYVVHTQESKLAVYVKKYRAAKNIAEAYTDIFSEDPTKQLEEGYRRYQINRPAIENKMGTEDANFSRVMRSAGAVLALILSFGATHRWFARSWASIWHKEDHQGKVVVGQLEATRSLTSGK